MATTPNRAYTYPTLAAAPDVPADLAALALGIDTDVQALYAKVPTIVEKSADQTITSSTTFANDTHLKFTSVAVGVYHLSMNILYAGANSPGDIKLQFTWPTGSGGYFSWTATGPHDAWADSATNRDFQALGIPKEATSPTSLMLFGAVFGSYRPIRIEARINLGVSGTIQLQWAQAASSATGTIIYAGSWAELRKVS